MVECRSNSRHMLTWLMDQMDAEKDSIFLAVTKAHEQGTGVVRHRGTKTHGMRFGVAPNKALAVHCDPCT
jgi:hypothetical protein